jgi:hypothetical protein
MATLTVELPDELLSRLNQSGYSAQELIQDVILQLLENEPGLTATELANRLAISGKKGATGKYNQPRPISSQRKSKTQREDLPREEVVRRLVEAGFVYDPGETDSPAAQEWRALSEEERQQHTKIMNETYFPDSPASRAAIEDRRGRWGEPTRTEVIARLVSERLIPQPGSWDDEYARAWRSRPEDERQRLIAEMHNLFFPDSFASHLISKNRR